MTINTWNNDGTLSVAEGGLGAASLTGILTGNGTSNVSASTVTTGEILLGDASSGVTGTGVLSKGVVVVGDGAGAPTLLTVGTNDHVLTADSAQGSGVKWAAAPAGGGSWTYISSATASASTNIEFTSGIDSTYDQYVFTLVDLLPATDDVILRIRTSTDGGTSFDSGASDYSWSLTRTNTSAGSWSSSLSTASSSMPIAGSSTAAYGIGNGAADAGVSGMVYLHDPSNATAYKSVHGYLVYGTEVSERSALSMFSGRRMAIADVDAVRFYFSSGNMASGTIRLYGVNNS